MPTEIVETYTNGVLVNSRTVTVPAEAVNGPALRDKAKQAIDANNTFLALAAPTNAQVVAQVQRLTREATALIKLELNDLADTAGT